MSTDPRQELLARIADRIGKELNIVAGARNPFDPRYPLNDSQAAAIKRLLATAALIGIEEYDAAADTEE